MAEPSKSMFKVVAPLVMTLLVMVQILYRANIASSNEGALLLNCTVRGSHSWGELNTICVHVLSSSSDGVWVSAYMLVPFIFNSKLKDLSSLIIERGSEDIGLS